MKILFVHPRLSVMGGGERVAIHSIKEALREGHEVYLACEKFDVEAFEDFFGVEGLFKDVTILNFPPFKPSVRRMVLYQRLIYYQRQMGKILSENRNFDFVFNSAEIANHPVARTPSGMYCYFPEYFSHLESNGFHGLWQAYYLPVRSFYRFKAQRIEQLLSVSNFTRDYVKQLWGREARTLYPPCPIEQYRNLNGSKENLVITIGRVSPEKRMELFLEIARGLPAINFAIIGSVPADKQLYFHELQMSAPANVSFVISPLRKAKDLLRRAKVYVHCARNEHFGITIVEAMAAGCIPVVHNSGGPREIVDDGVGFRWNSLHDAATNISQVIENESERRLLSASSARRSEKYRPEIFEQGFSRVLELYSNEHKIHN